MEVTKAFEAARGGARLLPRLPTLDGALALYALAVAACATIVTLLL